MVMLTQNPKDRDKLKHLTKHLEREVTVTICRRRQILNLEDIKTAQNLEICM